MRINIPGDINHTMHIHQVDCIEYMASLKENAFDLAICDPPYGIGIDKAINDNKGKQGFKQYQDTDWDSSPPRS